MLEINHVCKRYGELIAIKDFSLKMENGLYGFLGENGAGKSTLIKILSCNLSQDKGEILFDGKEIRRFNKEYRSKIGYLPQESVGYPTMSVQEFMEYIAVLKGMSIRDRGVQNSITESLKKVHLDKQTKKRFCELSGGMKRRLLFAQAILGTPDILILDEPTAGLDPNERIAMRNLIAQEAISKIVILATHIISDIECVANQIVLMKKGEIVGCASPEVWLENVENHVRELVCQVDDIQKIQDKYIVSNMRQCKEGICMRIIAEQFEEDGLLKKTSPTLDDVYLYYVKQN